jgi:hypothetical protein
MSLKFWTTLTMRKQAVFVEDGKIKKAIPTYPPKTIFRRAAVVTDYNGKLALVKQASFELWDQDKMWCITSFQHKLIYTPHDIVQVGEDLLICSSGLEMFFLMSDEGKVKWEWWGHENGIGAENQYFSQPDWETNQAMSDLCAPPIDEAAHFNSIFMTGKDTFMTAALRKRKIITVTVGKPGHEIVAQVDAKGCHSPFLDDRGTLIYGTEAGVQVGDKRMVENYGWIKYVRPFEDGFAFAHEKGIAITDGRWKVRENVPLPAPYKFAFMERTK